MKNVLYISYYFPPQASVGAARPLRTVLATNPERIKLTILSVSNPDSQFHPLIPSARFHCSQNKHSVYYAPEIPIKLSWQIPATLLKRWKKLTGKEVNEKEICSNFFFIDMEYGWILPCILKGLRLAKKTYFDGVVVSVPPFSTLFAAIILKKILNVPLLADFRDAWTLDTYHFHTAKMRNRELDWLKEIDSLIVTSWSDLANYQGLVPAKKIKMIPNGLEHHPHINPQPSEFFTILYTGSWGTFNSTPESLLQALTNITFDWRLITIPESKLLERSAARLGLDERITSLPYRNRSKLDELFSKSDLLFISKGIPSYGNRLDTHISAKLYDYCATGKPILAELPEGDSLRFVRQYAPIHYHCPPNDIEKLTRALDMAYQDWQRKSPLISNTSEFISKFCNTKISNEIVQEIELLVSISPMPSESID